MILCIGLNAWLAAVQVPEVSLMCLYGEYVQNVRYVLLYYSRQNRENLSVAYSTERFNNILIQPEYAK
jgi:hypothetical protein